MVMSKDKRLTSKHAAPKQKKPTRYSKTVRVTVSIVSVFMTLISVLLMTAGGYVMYHMNLIVSDSEVDQGYVDSIPPDEDDDLATDSPLLPEDYNASEVSSISLKGDTKDVTNYLLLGIDARTVKERGRSDTMMIVTVNDKTKTIKLSSLLRDTAVSIPGRDKNGDGRDDYAKLNAAYAYGRFDLLSKTIEQNFRLKIDKYIGVNFVTFPIIVDAMGGVDIEMTKAETAKVCSSDQQKEEWERGFKRIGTEAGTYHLNGYQALQFARIRHIDSDFNRTGRQRQVISKLMEKAKTMSFGTLTTILGKALPNVITNMSGDELMGLALDVGKYASYKIESDFHLPETGQYTNYRLPDGGAALALKDPVQSVNNLHTWIYG